MVLQMAQRRGVECSRAQENPLGIKGNGSSLLEGEGSLYRPLRVAQNLQIMRVC